MDGCNAVFIPRVSHSYVHATMKHGATDALVLSRPATWLQVSHCFRKDQRWGKHLIRYKFIPVCRVLAYTTLVGQPGKKVSVIVNNNKRQSTTWKVVYELFPAISRRSHSQDRQGDSLRFTTRQNWRIPPRDISIAARFLLQRRMHYADRYLFRGSSHVDRSNENSRC